MLVTLFTAVAKDLTKATSGRVHSGAQLKSAIHHGGRGRKCEAAGHTASDQEAEQ